MSQGTFRQRIVKETALFVGLLFFGLVIAPIAIYLVGPRVLGEFGGSGYADFFGDLSARIRGGDLAAWFFVLAPWLVWQVLRLTAFAWRATGRKN
jgi:hypothetical protein